ncbi:MAG: hypothetical protein ABI275_00020 [Terrimesophilobacter sp.]
MPNESVLTGAEWDARRAFPAIALGHAPGQQLRTRDIDRGIGWGIGWGESRVTHRVTGLERRRLIVRSA